MKAFAGSFETHLTIHLPGRLGNGDEELARWAAQRGMKYARILFDQGETSHQPMFNYHASGMLPAQLVVAERWVGELRGDGFDVLRVKVEAALWNEGVPRNDAEASALMPGCYFENHVKLAITDDAEVDAVRRIGARHAEHLSWNARHDVCGETRERFVTQRCRLVGRPEAHRRMEALLRELVADEHRIIETEEEFVVHDDNPGLDKGWDDAAEA